MNKIFHISKNCRKGALGKAHDSYFMSSFAGTKNLPPPQREEFI